MNRFRKKEFVANEMKMFTASGQYCSGDLIFEDTFDIFDTRKWQHENTLSGGGVSNEITRRSRN